MTFPVAGVDTVPYCGACGRETVGPWAYEDLNNDAICDGCGADLLAFGWAGLLPPAGLVVEADLPIAGWFTASFGENPGSDTTDLRWRINNGAWTEIIDSGSPESVDAGGTTNDKVDVQARSVANGVDGPWSVVVFDTFA